jgi:large repetitive protein
MASAKRGKHAKRPTRANRASGLAVAVGLGIAVATTGHGVASATTGDQTSGSPDTDTGSNTTTESGTTTSEASGTTATTGTQSNTSATTTTTTSETTTTSGGDGPTSSVSASGGAGTTVSNENSSGTTTNTPSTQTPAAPTQTAEPTTEKPAPTETVSETTDSTPETTSAPVGNEKSTTPSAEETAAPATETLTAAGQTEVKQGESAETLVAATESTESTTGETTQAPAARMMAASAVTSPRLPTITLPPYPTIPGVSPTKVALFVVVVLANALKTALSGPVPNPIAIPIYLVLVAAYQRLTEIAYNHVPVAGTPSTPLQLPTGTVIGDIGTATDQDGDPLRYTVTTQPTKGAVALVGTAYVYTPSALLSRDGGTDSFTVTIDDLQGAVDHPYAPNGHTTTETITINYLGTGIDLPPVVTATQGPRDAIGVVRGGFTVVDLDDLDGSGRTFSLANGNTAGATATSAFTSLGGIVTLNQTTGNWTYIPAVSGDLLGIPTHTDTFVVTVADGHPGGTVQTTVSVGADLGIAVTGTSTNVSNGAYSGGLNIPAGDGGLLIYGVGTGPSSKGSVVVNADGTFTYTPTAAARHAAAADNATTAQKTDSFTIVGTDASGRSITVATVAVTLSTTNTAPTGSSSVTAPGTGGVVTGMIIANDADNDTLSYGPTTITTGKGTVTVNTTTGTFSYQPTDAARHAASTVGAGTSLTQDNFSIDVSDGHGGVTAVGVTVTISPKNTNPTVNFGTPLKLLGVATYTPSYSDADGDTVTFTITRQGTNGTAGLNLSVLGLLNTVVYTANNVVFPAHDSFDVLVSDGHGYSQTFTLNPY